MEGAHTGKVRANGRAWLQERVGKHDRKRMRAGYCAGSILLLAAATVGEISAAAVICVFQWTG
jgi:hypothetical protein